MTRIKICGITNLADAQAAVEMGANAVGFVFAEGPRRIDSRIAGDIARNLPPFVDRVGVFVDEEPDTIRRIAAQCSLNTIQLHGQESQSYIEALNLPVIKAFRIRDRSALDEIKRFNLNCFLLDTYDQSQPGGTGKTFDWAIARAAKSLGKVILGGGLNTDNITEALDRVQPYAVDVSSGVEKSPGLKDHRQMEDFIRKVKLWDNRTN